VTAGSAGAQRRLAAVAAGVAVAALVLAPVPAARGAFERPPLDAPSAALGGVVATSADPVFGNPAGAALGPAAGPRRSAGGVRALHAAFELARPFGLPGLSEAQAGLVAIAPWGWGVGARRFGSDAYAETEIRGVVAGGRAPAAFGGAVRLLQVDGAGFAARRSAALDLAFRWNVEPGLVAGAVAEAVLGELPGGSGGDARRTAFGVARRLGPFRLVAEAQRREPSPLSAVLGAAWEPRPGLAVSAGAREDPASASAGLSLPVPGAVVSLSGTWVPPLGTTFRLGVRLRAANENSSR
jgi:hypothetical protein